MKRVVGILLTAAACTPALAVSPVPAPPAVAGRAGVEISVYPAGDTLTVDPSAEAVAFLRQAVRRSIASRREWVGCLAPGGFAQVFDSPAKIRSAGASGIVASTELCPEGMGLAHTHLNTWDRSPSKEDCRNLASRGAPFDVIALGDTTRLRLVVFRRC